MGSKNNKIESITDELLKLNKKFHSKSLLTESFYVQLEQAGFMYKKCILINLFPDSSNTYCGKIIRQDGQVFEFDIDLDSHEYFSLKSGKESFNKINTNGINNELRLEQIAALNLFRKLKEKE